MDRAWMYKACVHYDGRVEPSNTPYAVILPILLLPRPHLDEELQHPLQHGHRPPQRRLPLARQVGQQLACHACIRNVSHRQSARGPGSTCHMLHLSDGEALFILRWMSAAVPSPLSISLRSVTAACTASRTLEFTSRACSACTVCRALPKPLDARER